MIVRILSQGQFLVPDEMLDELNALDEKIAAAVDADDQAALTGALRALIEHVHELGSPVDADLLIDSDVILPDEDVTVTELRELFADPEFGDGLIPD